MYAPDELITLDQAAGLIPDADDVIPSPWRPRNQPVPVSDQIDHAMFRQFVGRSCVYFVGNCQAVKIGVTEDIGRRLVELDRWYIPARVLLLAKGSYGQEREFHSQFAGQFIRKEWFRHDGKLAEFIARERVKFV